MKIRILSDLHVNKNKHLSLKWDKNDDTLNIIAGDISNCYSTTSKYLNKNFKKAIFISGNHILYNKKHPPLEKVQEKLRNKFSKGNDITYLENDYKVIEDIVFIGTTLWTDFSFHGNLTLDFDKINHNFTNSSHGHGRYLENGIKKNIDANFIKKLFNISLNSIYDIAKKFPDKKIVLITHHPICTDVIQKNWYDNKTVPACACNIGKEIVKNIPNLKLIVHGHVHQSHKYKIGKVPVICNPLGIIDLKTNNYENPEFDRNLIIEI